MNLQEIVNLFNHPPVESQEIANVVIDSREVSQGSLFVALKGENYDGHNFISDAAQKGAIAVLAEKHYPDIKIPQIIVKNTLNALGELSIYHRDQFDLPVIALTGSNGKTSVKEMIGTILPQPSFISFANFNNHIGVPLNVLSLKNHYKYAVFELGASCKGDIAYTVNLVKPKITLINNIAPAHIEGFGSIEGVAQAKSEIHAALPQDGYGIINIDDNFSDFFHQKLLNKNVIRFSATKPCDIYASDIKFDSLGKANFVLHMFDKKSRIQLNVPGMHNVLNSLAATASVAGLGVSFENILNGLENFSGVQGRMAFKQGKNNSLIIDDTYNANLKSVIAALKVVAKYEGKKIFVFGDMKELGDFSLNHHQEVGLTAKELGFNMLFTYGQLSENASEVFGKNARHYNSKQELIADLQNYLDRDTTILVKGSRSLKMEEVVNALID